MGGRVVVLAGIDPSLCSRMWSWFWGQRTPFWESRFNPLYRFESRNSLEETGDGTFWCIVCVLEALYEMCTKYEKRTDLQAMEVLLVYKSGPEIIPEPEETDSGIKGFARLTRRDAVITPWCGPSDLGPKNVLNSGRRARRT